MLQKPTPIRPRIDDAEPAIQGPGPSSAPLIPPIVPVPLAPAAATTPNSRSATPASAVSVPQASNVGPVLGGTGAGLAQAPTRSGPTAVPPPSPTAPTPNVGPPPGFPSLPSKASRPTTTGTHRSPFPPPSSAVNRNPIAPNASPRSFPPSGLIGGTPGMNLHQPGGTQPSRRVNPVGGVIGGGGAGTAPTGAAGSRPGGGRGMLLGGTYGMPPLGGSPGSNASTGITGQPRQSKMDDESRRWDPEHPWEVDEGVAPVVRPPDEEGPIDPGPAIGFRR